ncbi:MULTISPECIES: hypothetical protein [Chryseobacterium]|uniref:Uncharacterized protein n=1 Tax=Chryseobacterium pennae TaxID=2258962 RepID=A0A3D9C4E6_9FLAO|nr:MULTISPECIES: hypothetical protein [Chryseobacterium]MCS4302334.1 hypothetical protein [Chryseobacterium sp. BIGb0232]REC60644.1 hypothetical protein DRF65_19560 [Chryseobacterium pennae]ROS18279.1 hypothetical protein EDF65_2672 [Chryseobacterium nakagawai]
MKTLQLFNAVLAKKSDKMPFISNEGFIIETDALWAKKEIISYYAKEKLNGNDLNKSFHKSWEKIKNTSRIELFFEQIQHYISTYGSNFQSEIYIPKEILNVPDVKMIFKVIKAYTVEEMQEKCLSLLRSGIALKEETINDLLYILTEELDYDFTGKENIRNKEAIIKIADLYEIYPENPVEFFRYVIYKTTQTTLLIKNDELIGLIKQSKFNPTYLFESFGMEKMAEIFNRFKPLFLAYKNRAPKAINKISKLSKVHHKPLISNPLNDATHILLETSDWHWLENATPFALFKALSACHSRMYGQDTFVYRVRNGKSWVKKGKETYVNLLNYDFILDFLKLKYESFSGKKFYFPENVEFALPTSEKMFVGNIPTGTRFYGDRLAVGIYWEDRWGARDLDLSGLNIEGKIGWNAAYNYGEGQLMYSGDMTSAPNGAVEYLYANKGLSTSTLVMNNVFSGDANCGYKIVIGKGDQISYDYMMNPNNLFAEARCNSVQKQTILGILLPKVGKQCFVLLNFGAGHSHVSGNNEVSMMATSALYQQWSEAMSFNELIKELGAETTTKKSEADFDFSMETLEKDSFIRIFK